MSKKEPRFRRSLRALRGSNDDDAPDTSNAAPAAEESAAGADASAIDGLEKAVASIEAKLESGAGIDGLAEWLREVEATVTALSDPELDRTRDDIRSVIDRLLGINAEIQNVVRLKKLLS